MRLSKCKINLSSDLIEELKDCFPETEFRNYFPANFENKTDRHYADVVLVDRKYNQYPISVRLDEDEISVTLDEYDMALHYYDSYFGINVDIETIGNSMQNNIKSQAELAISRILNKRKAIEKKRQLRIETEIYTKFLKTEISTLKLYITQEILNVLNGMPDLKNFVIWQVLSGIPHFGKKLPSAKWVYTSSGMYDISNHMTPYIKEVSENSDIRAIESDDNIEDHQKGRLFRYNRAIEVLENESIKLFPPDRFFKRVTEIRARLMQIVKRANISIFDSLSLSKIGIDGHIKLK